jgi:ferredoxin
MKIAIDRETCIECGSCEATCPEVFKLPSGEKSTVVEKYRINGLIESGEVPANLETCAENAVENCPVNAISANK